MTEQQFTLSDQTTSQIASINPTPVDPTPAIQTESPTAMIMAISILISTLLSGITGLVHIITVTKGVNLSRDTEGWIRYTNEHSIKKE